MSLLETILEPFAELVLRIACNGTGRLLIAVGTLGRVSVHSPVDAWSPADKWHGIERTWDGKIMVKSEVATMVGITFWMAIGATALWIHSQGPG